MNPSDIYPSYVVIYANGEVVLISFSLRNDRQVRITSLRLSLRFDLSEDFMFLNEEIYDTQSGNLINTIKQSLVYDRDLKEWLLRLGRYHAYSVSESLMAISIELVTSHQSSTSTAQLIPATRVKLEA